MEILYKLWDNPLIQNTLGNFLGSLILVTLIWLLSDYIFKYPDLNGKWKFIILITETKFTPFKGLKIVYDVYMYQVGDRIYGTGEKVKDIEKTKRREYEGKNRIRINIKGTIKRNLWKKNKAVIHIEEEGEKRISTSIHLLTLMKHELQGEFYSSISDQKGTVKWERTTL